MNAKGFTGRIDSLDYLRGLLALGVMFYHTHLLTYGEMDAASQLAKIKIYGVTIFFILSGLTLYKVYADRFYLTGTVLLRFYIKRFFRIVPLLWLVTMLTILFHFRQEYMSVKKLVANIAVLPGAVKPETFIADGAWSIGDELLFYMLFPFILWLAKYKKWMFTVAATGALLLMCYYCFYRIDAHVPLGLQWATYVNPLQHLFYFLAGIALGMLDTDKTTGTWSFPAALAVYLLLVFYPVSGEPVALVTGINRLVLSALVIVFCYLFYKTDFSFLPRWLSALLHFLGLISYSLYLLHPVVYFILQFFAQTFFTRHAPLLVLSTVLITIPVSYCSYYWFERYFNRIGKTFAESRATAKEGQF